MLYVPYDSEAQLPAMTALIEADLSEPYSIYTYRYFIHNWPELCFLALEGEEIIGVIICKLDEHKDTLRGYIGMLAVSKDYRKRGIGSDLVQMAVAMMQEREADEVVLEAEETNLGALGLYQNLGFIRDKRLARYYLNGVDAFRLKLRLR
ncbi:N-alpha-acetyltransferase 30 [Thoreauomyces humboldtii]|nr:N-alpha-acetyltransferase 30 [Thoreauomyces humboldtii]